VAIFRKSKPDSAQAPSVASEPAPMIGTFEAAPPVAVGGLPETVGLPEDDPSGEDPQVAGLVRAMREAAAASLAAGVLATREKASLPGALRLWRQAYLQMYGEELPLPPQPAEKEGSEAEEPPAAG